jgi:hypothetical protein
VILDHSSKADHKWQETKLLSGIMLASMLRQAVPRCFGCDELLYMEE